MLKEKMGIVLVAIALTLANGEPWIPIAVMTAGLWLMRGMIGDDESAEDL